MVGPKPNAYLTEEARLEAQRRMLAERYGLLSDDSDEAEEAADAPPPPPQQQQQQQQPPSQPLAEPPSSSPASATHPLSHVTHSQPHPLPAVHPHPVLNVTHIPSSIPSVSVAPPPGSNGLSNGAVNPHMSPASPPTSLAASVVAAADPSPAASSASAPVVSQPVVITSAAPPQPSPQPPPNQPPQPLPPWPTSELVLHAHQNRICPTFDLASAPPPHCAQPPRDVRVSPISNYKSDLLVPPHDTAPLSASPASSPPASSEQQDGGGADSSQASPTAARKPPLQQHRRVAADDRITVYPVGSFIHAVRRDPHGDILLKGHDSVVTDVEFLSATADPADTPGDRISILASVADDGSVYVWKLVSSDDLTRDNGSHEYLHIADSIRFEHPQHRKGASYSRVAFRPGPNSIISENGVGVAMLLLDPRSPDLRIVELVKMNDKMMVRDKFLKARNEPAPTRDHPRCPPDACLDAAAWLSESVMVTSRAGHVFLWAAANQFSACLARVPRSETTRVTDVVPIAQNVLMLVVEHGRAFEIWAADEVATDLSCVTVTHRQTLRLFASDEPDVYCVTAVDPAEQLVTIANAHCGDSFFALHFNCVAQAFDAVTTIPQSQNIYSFCISRDNAPPFPPAVPNAAVLADMPAEEVSLWCIQPRGINILHLPVKGIKPRCPVLPEVHPKPTPVVLRRKPEKLSAGSLPQQQVTHSQGTPTPPPKDNPSGPPPTKRAARASQVKPSAATTQGANGTTGATVDNGSGNTLISKGSIPQPKVVEVSAREAGVGGIDVDGKQSYPIGSNSFGSANMSTVSSGSVGASSSMPSGSVDARGKNSSPPLDENPHSGDDIADAILEAAKKAISSFEEAASQRTTNEKSRMDKLLQSVKDTTESNLEMHINSSMKAVMSDVVVPKISELIMNSRSVLEERIISESRVTKEHFQQVIVGSEINQMFSRGCKEMGRQIDTAVQESISSKYDELVKPTVEVVNDGTEDLTASVSQLRQEMEKMRMNGGSVEEQVHKAEPVDVRVTIEEHLNADNIEDAFEMALEVEDLSVVMWLCNKYDSSDFFETNRLSQVALISLAHQLGHGLNEMDVEVKVDWLREVMLVLEPEADDIESVSIQAVRELMDSVNVLRSKKEFVKQFDGLEKKLKTLSRLISSNLP